MTEQGIYTPTHPALARARPYRNEDMPLLVQFLKEARGWPPVGAPTGAQITTRWQRRGVLPEDQVRLIEGEDGLIAYWHASPWGDNSGRLGFDIAVHPRHRQQGLGSSLLALVEQEAQVSRSLRATCPVFVPVVGDPPPGVEFLAHRGYRTDHGYWQMRLDNIAGEAIPDWPRGIAVRAFRDLEVDLPRWCSLVIQAFGEETTPQGVLSQLNEPGASPSGYFFAVDTASGQEIGTSRGRVDSAGDERLGYIGTVGVLPEYRRRGIAEALVRHTLGYLASQGLSSAILFVERQNTAARRIYDAMGWRAVYRTDHYWKSIVPGQTSD